MNTAPNRPVRNRLLAAMLAAVLVAACAVPPEQRAAACRSTDWQRYGVNDGRLGLALGERDALFAACASVGAPADVLAYDAGRNEGLRHYCTVENGFRVGYEGRRYRNACPAELATDFLQGYERGKAERPSFAVYPRVSIGVGHGGFGVGVGYQWHRWPHHRCGRRHRHCW